MPKKNQLNWNLLFYNLRSNLDFWHTKMYKLVRHTIFKMRFNNPDMKGRQIPKERNKIKGPSKTCRYIWYINTSKCVYWLDIHCVKVWWSYVLLNTNDVHFCDIILRHRRCFRPAQTNSLENQKSGHVRLN